MPTVAHVTHVYEGSYPTSTNTSNSRLSLEISNNEGVILISNLSAFPSSHYGYMDYVMPRKQALDANYSPTMLDKSSLKG